MSEAKGGAGHSSSKFPQDTRSSRPIGASSAPEALVGPGSAGGGSGAKASAGIVSPPNKFAGGPKKSSSNKFFRKHRRSSSTSSSEDLTQDLSCQQGPQNPQGTESPQVDVPPSLARGNTDDHQQPYHPKRFPSFKSKVHRSSSSPDQPSGSASPIFRSLRRTTKEKRNKIGGGPGAEDVGKDGDGHLEGLKHSPSPLLRRFSFKKASTTGSKVSSLREDVGVTAQKQPQTPKEKDDILKKGPLLKSGLGKTKKTLVLPSRQSPLSGVESEATPGLDESSSVIEEKPAKDKIGSDDKKVKVVTLQPGGVAYPGALATPLPSKGPLAQTSLGYVRGHVGVFDSGGHRWQPLRLADPENLQRKKGLHRVQGLPSQDEKGRLQGKGQDPPQQKIREGLASISVDVKSQTSVCSDEGGVVQEHPQKQRGRGELDPHEKLVPDQDDGGISQTKDSSSAVADLVCNLVVAKEQGDHRNSEDLLANTAKRIPPNGSKSRENIRRELPELVVDISSEATVILERQSMALEVELHENRHKAATVELATDQGQKPGLAAEVCDSVVEQQEQQGPGQVVPPSPRATSGVVVAQDAKDHEPNGKGYSNGRASSYKVLQQELVAPQHSGISRPKSAFHAYQELLVKNQEQRMFKVLLIGDPGVGKTSFVHRFTNNEFRNNYKGTVGVDFALKTLQLPNGDFAKLQLWDIAGQERFTWMTRVYYKDARGCIIMFDLTSKNSFINAEKWKRDLDTKCVLPNGNNVPCLLLANKCDLKDRKVETEDIDRISKEHGFIGWTDTSAKDNTMIIDSIKFLLDIMTKNEDTSNGGGGNRSNGGGGGGMENISNDEDKFHFSQRLGDNAFKLVEDQENSLNSDVGPCQC